MNVEVDISRVVLKTKHLLLRAWRPSDLDDLYEYASMDGVGPMAGWKPHASKEESKQILDGFIDGKRTLALEYQGKVIGSLEIQAYDEKAFPEFSDERVTLLGFALSKPYWGHGLMPEAVQEVVRYCFEELGVDKILCSHFLWNKQSQRVQEKCGFRPYAPYTHATPLNPVEKGIMNLCTRADWAPASQ